MQSISKRVLNCLFNTYTFLMPHPITVTSNCSGQMPHLNTCLFIQSPFLGVFEDKLSICWFLLSPLFMTLHMLLSTKSFLFTLLSLLPLIFWSVFVGVYAVLSPHHFVNITLSKSLFLIILNTRCCHFDAEFLSLHFIAFFVFAIILSTFFIRWFLHHL